MKNVEGKIVNEKGRGSLPARSLLHSIFFRR